jgi:hypothetical protein
MTPRTRENRPAPPDPSSTPTPPIPSAAPACTQAQADGTGAHQPPMRFNFEQARRIALAMRLFEDESDELLDPPDSGPHVPHDPPDSCEPALRRGTPGA